MKNLAKFGLAAALAFGAVANASASEGGPDLSYPPGYENAVTTPRAAAQPRRAAPQQRAWRGDALDAYGWARNGVQPFTAQEQRWFDQATGNVENAH